MASRYRVGSCFTGLFFSWKWNPEKDWKKVKDYFSEYYELDNQIMTIFSKSKSNHNTEIIKLHCGCMQVEAAAHANLNVTRALSGDFLFWPHFHILRHLRRLTLWQMCSWAWYHLTILIKMASIGDQLLNRLKCQHFHKLIDFTDDVTVVSKDTFLIWWRWRLLCWLLLRWWY